MRTRRALAIGAVAGLTLLAATYGAGVTPMLRSYVLSAFNDPKDLPALEMDARVHFQRGAEACAREVAALLPAAIASIETAQGRNFARAPIVGVYASFDDYARANGFDDAGIAATSRSGRVILSPTLCGEERDRLKGVLTHELSHTHFFGWRSSPSALRPPSWFTEGLAVMVSDGGGAEGLGEERAAEALAKGQAIVVADKGWWADFASIGFETEPPREGSQEDFIALRQRLAFRQAAMFVAWLRRGDPKAFARMLNRLEDNEDFGAAFRAEYAASPAEQWRKFREALSK